MDTRKHNLLDNEIAEFENVIRVNLTGAFWAQNTLLGVMKCARLALLSFLSNYLGIFYFSGLFQVFSEVQFWELACI